MAATLNHGMSFNLYTEKEVKCYSLIGKKKNISFFL